MKQGLELLRQSDLDVGTFESAISGVGTDGWDWLRAGVVFVAAIVLSRGLKLVIRRLVARRSSDPAIGDLIGRLVAYTIVVFGLIYALDQLGVQVGPLLGALGIVGIAVAFALKDILENFVAGLLLQIRRPFSYGDQIISGDVEGTVRSIDARSVTVATPDGETVHLPSSQVITAAIVNHTQLGKRRTTIPIGVSYGTDLRRARDAFRDAVEHVDAVLPAPAPEVLLTGFGDSSIDFVVRFWHAPSIADHWACQSAVAFALHDACRSNGIEIPFPQRVLWRGDGDAVLIPWTPTFPTCRSPPGNGLWTVGTLDPGRDLDGSLRSRTMGIQASVTLRDYMRVERMPTTWCPGCGLGIITNCIVQAISLRGLAKDDVAMISGIGCTGRMSGYVDVNTIHTTHGRAPAFATGLKMADPDMTVLTVMGDGDAMSIGGNHLVHAMRRNIGMVVVVVNNNVYGLTGGQSSPTTPIGGVSTTTTGSIERPMDLEAVARTMGAPFFARTTVNHTSSLVKLVERAIEVDCFVLIEVISNCHTVYGRMNGTPEAAVMIVAMDGETKLTESDPGAPQAAPGQDHLVGHRGRSGHRGGRACRRRRPRRTRRALGSQRFRRSQPPLSRLGRAAGVGADRARARQRGLRDQGRSGLLQGLRVVRGLVPAGRVGARRRAVPVDAGTRSVHRLQALRVALPRLRHRDHRTRNGGGRCRLRRSCTVTRPAPRAPSSPAALLRRLPDHPVDARSPRRSRGRLPEVGGVFIQMEDEIASMARGASARSLGGRQVDDRHQRARASRSCRRTSATPS